MSENRPTSQVHPSNTYVSINQAASILWVDRSSIRRWLKQGRLRGETVGNVTLIPKQDVLAMALQRGIRL
jgi:excisionase family DNA binding protein